MFVVVMFAVITVTVRYFVPPKPPATPPAALHLRPVLKAGPPPCDGTDLPDTENTACYGLDEGMTVGQAVQAKAGALADTDQWVIQVTLNPADAAAFGELTGRLARESSPRNQLAIVIDGKVVSAPVVEEPIPGGEVQISGDFTRETATAYARRLNGES
ncbi:hypothetical protein GCM10010517_74180 [Streptosporangium fragile]|uniref:SecDF P1 head subdomain domain-containing protein n=1 Tax=Streptosporangium fragile TaxID=46186 RepID=A0ABN3WAF5_9ACTN